jgi:chromosome segregation ATPase
MSKQTIYNILAAKSEPVPMKIELANIEQLKDAFLNKFKKHTNNRDNVLARVRDIAAEVGTLEREAIALNNDIDEINKSAQQAEKLFRDLGIEPPQSLSNIGNMQIGAYANLIADTFGAIQDIPSKFK